MVTAKLGKTNYMNKTLNVLLLLMQIIDQIKWTNSEVSFEDTLSQVRMNILTASDILRTRMRMFSMLMCEWRLFEWYKPIGKFNSRFAGLFWWTRYYSHENATFFAFFLKTGDENFPFSPLKVEIYIKKGRESITNFKGTWNKITKLLRD